jgi:hypothetical protein
MSDDEEAGVTREIIRIEAWKGTGSKTTGTKIPNS